MLKEMGEERARRMDETVWGTRRGFLQEEHVRVQLGCILHQTEAFDGAHDVVEACTEKLALNVDDGRLVLFDALL